MELPPVLNKGWTGMFYTFRKERIVVFLAFEPHKEKSTVGRKRIKIQISGKWPQH